jgi:hypothetical protein
LRVRVRFFVFVVASYGGQSGEWPNDFVSDGLAQCRGNASGFALGAFLTCLTLVFALMGTVNRMKSERSVALGPHVDDSLFFFLTRRTTLRLSSR